MIFSPAKPIALSQTKDIVVNNAIMTASNDAGSGILHNLAGRCAIMATIDKEAKTIERSGHCNYTDKDGDMVFEDFSTSPQPMGSTFTSKGSWTGGTGKYAGLSGEFAIQSNAILSTESLAQVVGKKIGGYKLVPEPMAASK